MKKNTYYKINWNRFVAFLVTVYTLVLTAIFWVVSLHTQQGPFMLQVLGWTWITLTFLTLVFANLYDKKKKVDQE